MKGQKSLNRNGIEILSFLCSRGARKSVIERETKIKIGKQMKVNPYNIE